MACGRWCWASWTARRSSPRETCALDIIGAEYVRDIKPGEMVVVDKDGIHSHFPFKPQPHRFCVFEYIYFARPDSTLEGRNVYEARKSIGAGAGAGSARSMPTW